MTQLLCLIPLFPLLSFLLNGLFGARLKALGGWIAVLAMACSATISVRLLFASMAGSVELPYNTGPLWEWIGAGSLNISVALHYDQLTAIMCFVVTFVGSLVFLYSVGYMKGDPGFNRFFAYLSLFAFSMLVLVLGSSLPLLFVGWEGVGLCSYLLIGYYLDMKGAPDAGKKAFIVNRVGDAGFLLAMALIFKTCGTLEISEVVRLAPLKFEYGGAAVTAAALLLFLGCTGKSAQIPLFVWLPDAMAGPTPVSALIHAATMVTAGVYLVARTSAVFALAPFAMEVMAVVGCATAFVAGTIALSQRDIKKVLAYSTVSQLGYMFLACGVGAFSAGMFHVFTHAFFKACLFLGAGAVIHACGGVQDLFMMGGLKKPLGWVWGTFLAACLAISGFPLTAGFFSKDEILWQTFHTGHIALYVVGLATAVMTICYSWRALHLAFHGPTRLPAAIRHHIHAPDWTMTLPLVILALGSIFLGLLNVPHAMGHGMGMGEHTAFFEHFLGPVLHPAEEIMRAHTAAAAEASPGAELGMAFLSSILVLCTIAATFWLFLINWPNAAEAMEDRFSFLGQLSKNRWWWDDVYNVAFGGGTRALAQLSVATDRGVIDGLLTLIAKGAKEAGRGVRKLQSSGQVQAYALAVLIGVNILILAALLLS